MLRFNKKSDTLITVFKSNNIQANNNSEATVSYMPFKSSLKLILVVENYIANLPTIHKVNAGTDLSCQNSKQTSPSCGELGCIP